MKSLVGTTRIAFLSFFASHIIFSLLLDIQAILPESIIPTLFYDFRIWYASTMNDPLMSNPKEIIWFQSLVLFELILQVPFFFIACYYLSNNPSPMQVYDYPVWFGPACMAYGGHVATTLIPILATLITNSEATIQQRIVIVQIYLPYLLFPLWILYLAAIDHIETYKKIKSTKTL